MPADAVIDDPALAAENVAVAPAAVSSAGSSGTKSAVTVWSPTGRPAGMTTEAWPDATGTAPRAAPSTAKVTVPAAEAPPEALTDAVAVVPAGSGVTDSATVAVAATAAAELAEVDDGADDGLGVEVWTAAAGSGVPTDDSVPEPLTAGPHAASRTHSAARRNDSRSCAPP